MTDEFEYTKDINILEASGNVKIFDKINNYEIFSNKITYNKNKEIIYTKGKSKLKVWTIVLQLTRMTLNMKNY